MNCKLPQTTKEYYLIVDRNEVYQKAIELGADQAVLFDAEKFDTDDVSTILNSSKAVAFAFFCKSDDKHLERLRLQLHGKEMLWFTLMEGRIYGQDISYDSIDKVVKNLKGIIKAIENNLKYRGYISLTDYKNRCGNCHAELLPEDNYCKQCGTKRGEGAFEPYKNEMCGLYGPPTTSVFRCQSCKDTFSDWTIGTSRVKFCPKCGSSVKRIKEVLE